MRGHPANQGVLHQLKQAWWALWSVLQAPHHYHPRGLINHWPAEEGKKNHDPHHFTSMVKVEAVLWLQMEQAHQSLLMM